MSGPGGPGFDMPTGRTSRNVQLVADIQSSRPRQVTGEAAGTQRASEATNTLESTHVEEMSPVVSPRDQH